MTPDVSASPAASPPPVVPKQEDRLFLSLRASCAIVSYMIFWQGEENLLELGYIVPRHSLWAQFLWCILGFIGLYLTDALEGSAGITPVHRMEQTNFQIVKHDRAALASTTSTTSTNTADPLDIPNTRHIRLNDHHL